VKKHASKAAGSPTLTFASNEHTRFWEAGEVKTSRTLQDGVSSFWFFIWFPYSAWVIEMVAYESLGKLLLSVQFHLSWGKWPWCQRTKRAVPLSLKIQCRLVKAKVVCRIPT
jgi:hypothetical protein